MDKNNERHWSTSASINGRDLMFNVAISAWLPDLDENEETVHVDFSNEDAKQILIETLRDM